MKCLIRFFFGWIDYRNHSCSFFRRHLLFETRRSKLIAGRNYLISSVALWRTERGNYFETMKGAKGYGFRGNYFETIKGDKGSRGNYYTRPLEEADFRIRLFELDRETFNTLYCLDEDRKA